VQIRSTIKSGEFKGKKCCPPCKQKIEGVRKEFKPIKKATKKGMEKRKKEREGLPEFFKYAIKKLKENPYCQNCGCKINDKLFPVNNIAHLLAKSYYKSVMDNPYNFVMLCDSKDNFVTGKSCHYDFDNKLLERPNMPVFQTALMIYNTFKDDVLEQGKEREIYENNL
jgi:hypothetical protein